MTKIGLATFLLLFVSMLPACDGQPTSSSRPMIHSDAVVYLVAGRTEAQSPISGNFSVSPDGRPEEYGGSLHAQGNIAVHYEFVGVANAWVPGSNPNESIEGDVYVVRIQDQHRPVQKYDRCHSHRRLDLLIRV